LIDAAAAGRALSKCWRILDKLDAETRAYVLAGLVPSQHAQGPNGHMPDDARARSEHASLAARARWDRGRAPRG